MNAVSGQKGSLLHVIDSREQKKWLVDGGALLSIIPPTAAQRLAGPNGTRLQAANGSNIDCFGTISKTLTIGDRSFTFEFIIADVRQRILGADFLANFYLAPNHRDGVLLDLNTFNTLPATLAYGVSSEPVNFVDQLDDPYYKLLDSFPEVITPSFTPKEPKHGVKHYIPTTGRPVQSRARRLEPEKLAKAKEELEKLCKLGVARRAKSEWASPLLVVAKPDGSSRVCGDYRRLNNQTIDDKYPVRALRDFNSDLHGKKIFSKIDLLKGYHQIPVAEEDVCKTGVITPFGLYVFPRTPFGLKNAGQDFQRLMDEILGDLPRVFVYIDDILVASETPEQHLEDLKQVFQILSENGLVVNRAKCVLGKSSIEFLGYNVDTTGVSPLPDRVAAIRETKPPKTVKDLQSYLGMLNYYRRFIPHAAHHLYPLFEVLKGKPKTLNWTPDCQKSFEASKEALAAATLLHHPIPGAQLNITSDASKRALGGVLEQMGQTGWEPLAFYSAKLEPHQTLWPPYDRELLAAFKSVRNFKYMVEGRPFILYSDHQSLVPSMSKKTDPQTARQIYQLACISEYTTDIRYVEGKSNVVADALSRPPLDDVEAEANSVEASQPPIEPAPSSTVSTTTESQPTTSKSTKGSVRPDASENLGKVVNSIGQLGINLEEMARDQPLDRDYQQLTAEARTGLQFKTVDLGGNSLIVDISNGPARPFVPFSWRRRVFEVIHNLGHPGVERTRQSVAAKFVWPSMREDTSKWARECLTCQRSKVSRHTVPPIGDFKVPNRRFEHWNIDLVTLPPSNGFRYLLTAVDRFTRWPIAVPIPDISAETVMDALAHGLVASFGIPSSITTDRGSQFSSALWQQLLKTWNIKAHFTTAYHPAANGLVERFHRRLKEALIALGNDEPSNWFWRLPCALLAIRTTLKPDVGASPADMVYGEGLAVPGTLLSDKPTSEAQERLQRTTTRNELRLEVARLQPIETSAHRVPHVHVPTALETATHVFIRRGGVQPSLSSPYTGPYRVVSRERNSYRIALPGVGTEAVSIERLKPAHSSDEDADDDEDEQPQTPPSPPPPGRRPGPRTRTPAPTDRQTRQSTRMTRLPRPAAQPQASAAPAAPRAQRQQTPNIDEFCPPPPPPPPPPPAPSNAQPHSAAASNLPPYDPGEGSSTHGGADPPIEPSAAPTPRRPQFFSDPKARKFSKERPNISYAAPLAAILQQLNEDNA